MKETKKYQKNNSSSEHLDDNEIAQYADYLRKEAAQIPDKLIDHVASCSYCRAELMAITDMLDSLPDLVEEGEIQDSYHQLAVPDKRRTNGIRWLRSAAAIAAVLLLAWIVQELVPDRPSQTQMATNQPAISAVNPDSSSDTAQDLSKDTLHSAASNDSKSASSSVKVNPLSDTVRYASAFLPNSTYENLVSAKYRSGKDPKVTGPNPVIVFTPGDTLEFVWTPDPEDLYVLIILDNQAHAIKEIKPGNKALINWKIDLKPGLYYWKFLGKEELWKVGKFTVRD